MTTPDWPIPDEVILANAAARRRYEQARRREETLFLTMKILFWAALIGYGVAWACFGAIDVVDYVRGVTR